MSLFLMFIAVAFGMALAPVLLIALVSALLPAPITDWNDEAYGDYPFAGEREVE